VISGRVRPGLYAFRPGSHLAFSGHGPFLVTALLFLSFFEVFRGSLNLGCAFSALAQHIGPHRTRTPFSSISISCPPHGPISIYVTFNRVYSSAVLIAFPPPRLPGVSLQGSCPLHASHRLDLKNGFASFPILVTPKLFLVLKPLFLLVDKDQVSVLIRTTG